MDNIFVKRLWRTVKYEEVYLKSYETVRDARESLARYFHFYNTERLHQALGYPDASGCLLQGKRYQERLRDKDKTKAGSSIPYTTIFFVLTMRIG